MRRWMGSSFACIVVAVMVAMAVPAEASSYPIVYNFPAGITAQLLHPGANPPGANNWSCHPNAAHPNPVVLVHGTFANMTDSWQALSPLLANHGYCVFALDYGGSPGALFQGIGPIETSAAQLSAFVDRVLAATGAQKVDMVGHSQGGMMPRYYLKFLGGAAKVGTLVGLAPSNHGTTLFGLTSLLTVFPGLAGFTMALCAACAEQVAGSAFLRNLNAGGDTVAGVRYTVIETTYDTVVTPYTSAYLSGPNVRNINLQDQCWLDFIDHAAIGYDSIALRDVLNALDPAHAVSPSCHLVLGGIGG